MRKSNLTKDFDEDKSAVTVTTQKAEISSNAGNEWEIRGYSKDVVINGTSEEDSTTKKMNEEMFSS